MTGLQRQRKPNTSVHRFGFHSAPPNPRNSLTLMVLSSIRIFVDLYDEDSILDAMQYRRAKTPGATYFFTIVTYERQELFKQPEMVDLLRQSFHVIKQRHPFILDAMVVLPDHLHCIWTLPHADADFSMRWRLIKSEFSRWCPDCYKQQRSASRIRKGEQAVWQRRFWEHQIRDELDFAQHVDYIHYNPVRHGLVTAPKDWVYSSFHRYIRDGSYPIDWGAEDKIEFNAAVGYE